MKKALLILIFSFIGAIIGGGIFIWNHHASESKKSTFVKDVPFTIDIPPKNSDRGIISSLKGEVKWESRAATEAARITSPVEIVQAEKLETEEDGNVTVHFQKGLDVLLSSN